jgi:hypothetical protein
MVMGRSSEAGAVTGRNRLALGTSG